MLFADHDVNISSCALTEKNGARFLARCCSALASMHIMDDSVFLVSEDSSVSIVFCIESQQVGVLLQDMVPFTGVDASCGLSRIKC